MACAVFNWIFVVAVFFCVTTKGHPLLGDLKKPIMDITNSGTYQTDYPGFQFHEGEFDEKNEVNLVSPDNFPHFLIGNTGGDIEVEGPNVVSPRTWQPSVLEPDKYLKRASDTDEAVDDGAEVFHIGESNYIMEKAFIDSINTRNKRSTETTEIDGGENIFEDEKSSLVGTMETVLEDLPKMERKIVGKEFVIRFRAQVEYDTDNMHSKEDHASLVNELHQETNTVEAATKAVERVARADDPITTTKGITFKNFHYTSPESENIPKETVKTMSRSSFMVDPETEQKVEETEVSSDSFKDNDTETVNALAVERGVEDMFRQMEGSLDRLVYIVIVLAVVSIISFVTMVLHIIMISRKK